VTGNDATGRDARLLQVAGVIVVAASILIRTLFWFRRGYNHDDFYFAYLSWLRSTSLVPWRDYYVPNFNAFTELWAPLFQWFPDSFVPLDAARALILAVSLVLVALTYRLTRVLTGSIAWALATTAVVSWQGTFMQRVSDIRGDAIAAAFLLGAVLLILESRPHDAQRAVRSAQRFFTAGLLAGFAVVFATKLVYALPFLLAGALWKERRFRAFASAAAGCAIAPLAYLSWRLAADGKRVVLLIARDVILATRIQGQTHENSFAALRSAPWLWSILAIGACALMFRRRGLLSAYAVLATAFIIFFFTRNPFLYPYNFVILLPVAAPLLAGLDVRPLRLRSAIIAAIFILAVVSGLNPTRRMLEETNAEQRRFVRWMWSATPPDEAVFDWQGMVFGRRSVNHWFLYGAIGRAYVDGKWFSLSEEWRRARVTWMIPNYRFEWVNPRDVQFLATHYIVAAPCLLAPGRVVEAGRNGVLDAVVAGEYAIAPEGSELVVDGTSYRGRVALTAGPHTLAAATRTTITYTSARRAGAGPPPCPEGPLIYGF
jgi:hypothetical protein